MTRQPLKSNHIAEAGFDSKTGEIEIQFKNKKVYRYADCTSETWDAFCKFPSPGKYFHRFLKRKKSRKIEPE